jgi:hypothetical protein
MLPDLFSDYVWITDNLKGIRLEALGVVRQNRSRPFYAPERHEPVRLC